jgi:putative two-component system response regulator
MTTMLADRQIVLVVDDTPENLTLMADLLKGTYKVKVANGGEKALRIAAMAPSPDLILLDVMMPGLDGYEVCRRLKADPATRDIPIVFLTAKAETEDERAGLELGAVDYITKPISPPIVLARVRNHLRLKDMSDFLRDKNAFLEAEVLRRTREVNAIQDVTILSMASLAGTRDNETGAHIRRTQHYIRALAKELALVPEFAPILTESAIELLFKSAPLHDIGKVGIPDHILCKPGPLTEAEFAVMRTHTLLGHDAIKGAEALLGDVDTSFLHFAREISYSHHEKWDGTGYPLGLAGTAIPLSGRMMAVADVYDALISKRVYKPAFSHEQATGIILDSRGSHFDPDIVDAFERIADEFAAIAARFADPRG